MARAKRRVLVVDDDPALREVVAELLSDADYQVTACADGNAALAELQRTAFDAVLSDIQMPDMDGLALLRAVRDLDLDLPVVLLTGGPSVESTVQAIEWGALQYLIKPVPAAKLLEATDRAVKLGALARLKREALMAMGSDQLLGDRAGMESSFQRALDGVWMAYQPIVRADDGSLHGYEALLRTTEPVFPNPVALLSAAEQLGRLGALGAAVRGSVAGLLEAGSIPGGVFVNLHPLDLADIAERIRRLRRLGYRIAIDDLGAGYAGLTSLATLAPDIVKFDMALIRGIDADVVKRKLVTSMAAVCRDLGITVVAEGIETEGERAAAVEAGCDLLQGYLLGRPARFDPAAAGAPG